MFGKVGVDESLMSLFIYIRLLFVFLFVFYLCTKTCIIHMAVSLVAPSSEAPEAAPYHRY